jgi:hypothetical protein
MPTTYWLLRLYVTVLISLLLWVSSGQRLLANEPIGETSLDLLGVQTQSLGLEQLTRKVTDCPNTKVIDCLSLVYVWSETMPLSILGANNAQLAAAELDIPFYLLEAEKITATQQAPDQQTTRLAKQLVAAGMHIHYPTIALLNRDKVVSPVLAGHKSTTGYRKLFDSHVALLSNDSAEPSDHYKPLQTLLDEGRTTNTPKTHISVKAQVSGRVGAFIQTLSDGAWFTFDRGGSNYAIASGSIEAQPLPGFVDPIPSKDGHFLFTPSKDRRGLEIYQLKFNGDRVKAQLALTDSSMTDQYPSVGVIGSGLNFTVYRVLTSWADSAQFNDYMVTHNAESGISEIFPTSIAMPACPGFQLSLPVISPDGLELAARDETSGTSKLFKLNPGGNCEELIDIGQAGKVGFSPSGRKIAYSIPQGTYSHGAGTIDYSESNALSPSGVFVLDRDTMLVRKMMDAKEIKNLTFPTFINEKQLLVMRYLDTDSPASQFLSLCCTADN